MAGVRRGGKNRPLVIPVPVEPVGLPPLALAGSGRHEPAFESAAATLVFVLVVLGTHASWRCPARRGPRFPTARTHPPQPRPAGYGRAGVGAGPAGTGVERARSPRGPGAGRIAGGTAARLHWCGGSPHTNRARGTSVAPRATGDREFTVARLSSPFRRGSPLG
ncbi:hypothetical protein EFW17_12985 [Halostreptopolyspora alba]|uniref:Uncharacterized protein n=1 Tax=Halostreptopolyspora alba TaxID=2487137 RepID=A0A3N0E8I0_9ACTN|nr:hypothetical protein EFW17_12985 [Nocardiopsaceae bacterium YIM 96095]